MRIISVLAAAVVAVPMLAGCNVVLPELDRDLLATFDAVEDDARQRCAAAQNVADCLAVEDADNMRFMHRMHRMSLTVGDTPAKRLAIACAPPGTDSMGAVADCFAASAQ